MTNSRLSRNRVGPRAVATTSRRCALRIAVLAFLFAFPFALTGCRLLAAGAIGAGAGYIAGHEAAEDDDDD